MDGKRDFKPVVGFFCFTCCEGCGFTVLFLDNLMQILDKIDLKYFNLIKEKDKKAEFDLAFVEGAITTKSEIAKLKKIRAKSKTLVAIGACACYGGIPAMRNFIENKDLEKYTYNKQSIEDSIEAQPIENFIKVDYKLRGCPILKDEFTSFIESYISGREWISFKGPVCMQCPRRGKNCFLGEKKMCLGAVTNGGCNATCVREGIPCIMCRGPLETANFPAEIALFKRWGVEQREIMGKLGKFGQQKLKKKENDKT